MERKELLPGVYVTRIAAEKFNRCRLSLHFTFPARRETATAHALLPLVMERGCASCPDMTEMTKKLARLYGADLTVDGRPVGANHDLCISVTGLKDAFALEGEPLTREYAQLLLDEAFHPYFVDGAFDPGEVAIEKEMLKKHLENEINEKRIYCSRAAQREFYKGTPAAIRQGGYLEEVDAQTPQTLLAAYQEMLHTAQIELMLFGIDEANEAMVLEALKKELSVLCREPKKLISFVQIPVQPVAHYRETFEMVQAKLCMMFTMDRPVDLAELQAYRLAMALFGGSVTSRLFLNVREKMHLCYYCSSMFQTFTGSMSVNSGIEPANAQRAEQAILQELENLCNGPISDEELEDCRRGLLSGFDSVEDSINGMESWYVMEIWRGAGISTPAQERERMLRVTKEDVRDVLKRFHLSVSYLLTNEEESHD